MKTRALLSLSLSTLVLGATMAGCSADRGGLASAGTRESAVAARIAAKNAGSAWKALTRHDAAGAIGFAEAAVGQMPQNADYRMMLGQAYLAGGRFASARAAFGDALSLEPGNGKAALNLTLAQIATGDWGIARTTLDTHSQTIDAGDRGLALALAGDPVGGVALLTQAARETQATPKLRQNLALALALAGQWRAARAVAAVDLSPADLDGRMAQWATFAQPQAAADQVASLLGIRPAADPGQPVALALNAAVSPARAVAIEPTVPLAAVAPVKAVEAMPMVAAPAVPLAATAGSRIAFAERREIVQPLVTVDAIPVGRPIAAPAKADAPARWESAGDWYVQLGAFENAAVARDGWARAVRRMPALRDRSPTGVAFQSSTGPVYRLSVGGFGRVEADGVCRRYRAIGGDCFVRRGAGDRMAQWLAKAAVQVAAR